MNAEAVRQILLDHIPAEAVGYCFRLWEESRFTFKITKVRTTKVGDFTFRPGRTQQITINKNLHPFVFLTTYIHEVAHLKVHALHGARILAHGMQWKKMFQELMQPVLIPTIYPSSLLSILKRHMADPKASSFSDPTLTAAFRNHDEKAVRALLLSQLPEGSLFGLQGKWYKKGAKRRTRALCVEIKTKKKYLVPLDIEVSSAQLSILV
jgi:SprT protein